MLHPPRSSPLLEAPSIASTSLLSDCSSDARCSSQNPTISITLQFPKIREFLAICFRLEYSIRYSIQELEKDLHGPTAVLLHAEKRFAIYDKIFIAYHDARSCIHNDLEIFLNATTMAGAAGNNVNSNLLAGLFGTQGAAGGQQRDGSSNPSTPGSDSGAPNTNPLPNPWSNTPGGLLYFLTTLVVTLLVWFLSVSLHFVSCLLHLNLLLIKRVEGGIF